MNILIESVGFTPSETLDQEITAKLKRAFEVYPYVLNAKVFLKNQPNESEENSVMEIRLMLKGRELFAETREDTFRKALTKNIEKLRRQLEKYKQAVYQSKRGGIVV